jgi:hypothetical protein
MGPDGATTAGKGLEPSFSFIPLTGRSWVEAGWSRVFKQASAYPSPPSSPSLPESLAFISQTEGITAAVADGNGETEMLVAGLRAELAAGHSRDGHGDPTEGQGDGDMQDVCGLEDGLQWDGNNEDCEIGGVEGDGGASPHEVALMEPQAELLPSTKASPSSKVLDSIRSVTVCRASILG